MVKSSTRSHSLTLLVIVTIISAGILSVLWLVSELEKPKPKYVAIEAIYLDDYVPTVPITLDTRLVMGLEYWGVSTPGGGDVPIYLNYVWLTCSREISGGYAYSSILQGCKPYNWGCGNYVFDPVPASEKLYLTVSFSKDTVDVYKRGGFAGALIDLWFENFKSDALVVDLYLTRDIKDEFGHIKSVGKGFVFSFVEESELGKVYHFNIVLTEAEDGELIRMNKLLLEPFIELAFESFRLNRSEWWLVSVDAGAEAHYAEICVYLYSLEVGKIAG